MGTGINVGINGVARTVKQPYIGVNGVARKVKRVYVGDANGVARLCYSAEPYYRVEAVSGASYGFALNSNNYYESQNKGVHNSYAICKIAFNSYGKKPVLDCINYAEQGYDYGLLSEIDTELTLSKTADSQGVFKNFKNYNQGTVQSVEFPQQDDNEHFIYVKFIKDSSQNKNSDSLQFKVRFE